MPLATSDGPKIHYQVEGRGEPLVLYHGLTGSGERWRDTGYTTGLGDSYRLILIDARGHGKSDKPHDQEAYGRRRQAADVVAVLDDLEIDATRFGGRSMGGDVALTLGRRHPERVCALVVTGYSPFAAAGEEAAEMAAGANDLQGGMEGFVTRFERRHGRLPEDTRARWLANDNAALAACVASMIAESDGSQVADLPAIETPVMLLVGTKEPFFEQARETANLLPHGPFVALEGLDHVWNPTQSRPPYPRAASSPPNGRARFRSRLLHRAGAFGHGRRVLRARSAVRRRSGRPDCRLPSRSTH